MKKKSGKFNALRKRAEALLSAPYVASVGHSMEEFCELLHELDTYRIELELQNDELLETQKQLQDTTQEYIDFYNFSPVGYVTLNSEGTILKANRTLASLFGLKKQAVINKPFSDFVLDSDQDIFYLYRQNLINTQHSSCELRLRSKNGQTVWVKLDGPFQTAQKGRVISLALTEINHLKEIEALLSNSETSLRAIFDSVLEGIIRVNEHGIIESVNAATESLFGHSPEAVLGSNINQLLPKLDWCGYKDKLANCRLSGESKIVGIKQELEGLKKDGSVFPIVLGISEISTTQPCFFIITIHDITERKQTEIALQEADRRKNEFLALLGHELRNPLVPIRNAVHMLKTQSASDSTLEWCSKIIDRQVSHMSQLLDDLLDVARIMQDKITLKMDCFDFAEIVDNAIETSYPLIEARKQELVIVRPKTSLWIKGDRVRLTQVLANLLNNAAKFTAVGGKITLKLSQEAEHLVIKVQDTGIGMSAEMLPYIFDIFTQANPPLARSQGGLGVGLTLARRLVELHGGTISATSTGKSQGSEFTVYLPLANAPSAKKTPQPKSVQAVAKLRILVVDDYADNVESLSLLLQIGGHDVETADCGLKAIEQARIFRPQVVLLDIGLPDISGYEVAKRLRELPETRQAFLIAISGYGGSEYLEQSESAGFDEHVLKPIDYLKLAALLATAATRLAAAGCK